MKYIVYDVDNYLLGSTAVSSLVEPSVEFVWLYIDSYLHFSIDLFSICKLVITLIKMH